MARSLISNFCAFVVGLKASLSRAISFCARCISTALSVIKTAFASESPSKSVTKPLDTAKTTTSASSNGVGKIAESDSMDELIRYAFSMVGVPYIISGNNPVSGLDCSGYVCELMRMGGEIGREDYSAQGLYDLFSKKAATPGLKSRGCLAFYGESVTKITHVAFMVSNYQILEAGGGDSTTTSIDEAKKRNAFVRGRIVDHRSDLVATLKPRYAKIGHY